MHATATTEQPTTQAPDTGPEPDAAATPEQVFRYSTWLHVGDGASACARRETGDCEDVEHWHAWVRLPNHLQHEDIRERALAAKARRMRQLRDPDTDASQAFDDALDELRRSGDRDAMIEELLAKDWWKRHLDALADVAEREEFAHVERDQERLEQLRAMPYDQRPRDELSELERHLAAHGEQVIARRTELERPLRESLEAKELEELVELVRDDRLDAEGRRAFNDTYSKWSWLAGTFTHRHPTERRRRFASVEDVAEADAPIIEALRTAFVELEAALRRGVQGN